MTLRTNLRFCHDFMVVIDTNCFEDFSTNRIISPYCAKDICHTFFADKKDRKYISLGQYYITEQVFNEIIQQRKEYYNNKKKELNDLSIIFNQQYDVPDNINFEKDLMDYLTTYNIQILPYPDNNIFPNIIKRAIEKKLPFKIIGEGKNAKASDKGFKDVLLWETLLEFNYESNRIGKVFLLTANINDFPEKELLPEWKERHKDIELQIITNWKDFLEEEMSIHPELIAKSNIDYQRTLEMFQDENPDIIELPNFPKKLSGRKDSSIVEIETEVKTKDGKIYTEKFFYDININDSSLIDPDTYNIIDGDDNE